MTAWSVTVTIRKTVKGELRSIEGGHRRYQKALNVTGQTRITQTVWVEKTAIEFDKESGPEALTLPTNTRSKR